MESAFYRTALLVLAVIASTLVWTVPARAATQILGTDYGQLTKYSVPWLLPDPYIVSVTSASRGDLYYDSPSVQSSTGSDFTQAILEFDVANLSTEPYHYLVLSPWSAYAGNSIPRTVQLFSYNGNGVVEAGDFDAGMAVLEAPISSPENGWYTRDSYGGFQGDTYVDASQIVANAVAAME